MVGSVTPPSAAPSRSLAAWLIQDARHCLDFERSRATTPLLAMRCWGSGQLARAARLLSLGQRRFTQLIEVEAACWAAGLSYPRTDSGQQAPWHLPAAFLDLPTEDLPAHPLIDGHWLAGLLGPDAPAPPAVEALRRLLRDDVAPARWAGVRCFDDRPQPPPAARIAVCLHLFYPELWPELLTALRSLAEPWDLFVSVPTFTATPALQDIARAVPGARFLVCDNRGRDVLPWLRWLSRGTFQGYELVCKLHTKRSPHMNDGAQWRARLLGGLLGTPAQVAGRLAQLRSQPAVGVAGSESMIVDPASPEWAGTNRHAVRRMRSRLGLPVNSTDDPFFAGTMFWFRPAAVAPLYALLDEAFPPEMGQTDGTTAHAIERLVVSIARNAGFELTAWPQS